ncbi:hypothetical protein ACEWMW_09670 [Altererythrobacter sp. MF3-039]
MDFVEEQGVNIIANGTFNPAIFHPAWLSKHGLITSEEEDSARLSIAHAEVSQFQIPGMKFDIQTERCLIQAAAEPLVRSIDLFARIFGELLPHTPIEAVGVNYWAHFRLNSWKQRQEFGRRLAPIEEWGDYGKLMDHKGKDDAGGFSTLAFRAKFPEYGSLGAINVTVQPSTRVENDVGVFMNINHHIADENQTFNFSAIVTERFDQIIYQSREIISHMISVGRSS